MLFCISLATSPLSCGFSGCNGQKKKKIVPTVLAPRAPLLIGSPANFAIKFHLKLQLNTDRAGGDREKERERELVSLPCGRCHKEPELGPRAPCNLLPLQRSKHIRGTKPEQHPPLPNCENQFALL